MKNHEMKELEYEMKAFGWITCAVLLAIGYAYAPEWSSPVRGVLLWLSLACAFHAGRMTRLYDQLTAAQETVHESRVRTEDTTPEAGLPR